MNEQPNAATLEGPVAPEKKSFMKSKRGQIILLLGLVAVVVAVWGLVFLNMENGNAVTGKPIASSSGSAAGTGPGATVDSSGSVTSVSADSSATPAAAGGTSADPAAEGVATDDPRVDEYIDEVFRHRDPFEKTGK